MSHNRHMSLPCAAHPDTAVTAQLVGGLWDVLEGAGIPAFVFGENLLGGAGELPLFGVLRVCVPDPCVPEADAALQAAGLAGEEPDPIPDGDPGLLPA